MGKYHRDIHTDDKKNTRTVSFDEQTDRWCLFYTRTFHFPLYGFHAGPLLMKGIRYNCIYAVLLEEEGKLYLYRSPLSKHPLDIIDTTNTISGQVSGSISSFKRSQHLEDYIIPLNKEDKENNVGALFMSIVYDELKETLYVTPFLAKGLRLGGDEEMYVKMYLLPD